MALDIEGMEVRIEFKGDVRAFAEASASLRRLGLAADPPSRRSLIEQHRCFPRGLHLDKDPLEVKAWKQPRRLWPRWCRGEWEHAEQRARGER